MIPVVEQSEPSVFAVQVGQPGAAFLKNTPNPTSWTNREYWRRIIPDLWRAYDGICAYTCHWIPPDVGAATVDHFLPKSTYPHRAYDWRNYRLATPKVNRHKSNNLDVVDPFTLSPGWFVLIFPALLLKPGEHLSLGEKQQVQKTIARLKLNDDEALINSRLRWVLEYCDREITFSHLRRRAPFIAYEIERQQLEHSIRSMFVRRTL